MKHTDQTISILGCGWYGRAAAAALLHAGFRVKGSTTSQHKLQELRELGITPFMVSLAAEEPVDLEFFQCDVLLIAVPPKMHAAGEAAYVSKIAQAGQLAAAAEIAEVVLISSTGVYGENNSVVDEDTPPRPAGPSGIALLAAEQTLQHNPAFSTTIIRFGGLIGPGRDPGRFFAGRKDISNGRAPVNLIHLEDCTGITLQLICQQAYGYTYNACAPGHPSRAAFYTGASVQAGLEKPEFKDELLSWKQVNSRLIATLLNYTFKNNL